MKKLILILALAFVPGAFTGCTTPPNQRVAAVTTLESIGLAAQTAIQVAGQLYQQKLITAAQLQQIADFYDQKFQPAYNLAVSAVNSNLSSVASPDLVNLAAQLSTMVAQYQTK